MFQTRCCNSGGRAHDGNVMDDCVVNVFMFDKVMND